uniref:Uncharacterized protein n=1 Tax=Plectus sambesii TaxID=2011161 RepID=A0A914XFG5_9BILA
MAVDGAKCGGSMYSTTKKNGDKVYPIFRYQKCKSTKSICACTAAINPSHVASCSQIDGRGTWFSSINQLSRNSSRLQVNIILMLLWGWARLFIIKQMRKLFGGIIGTANDHLLTD